MTCIDDLVYVRTSYVRVDETIGYYLMLGLTTALQAR